MAVDNYTVFLINNNGKKLNITQLCSNLSWRDSIETLGMELTFDIARNTEDDNIPDVVEIGNKLILKNNSTEIFRGIITDLGTERYKKAITAFDYAFYLNQSRTIIQFRKISAKEAISQLCTKFNVPIGNITSISTPITKIYKDKTIAEIIKDILKQATNELGIKYRLEMRAGKLYIEKYTDLIVTATFQPSSNLEAFNILDAIGNISKTESIQDMKNSIQITSGNEKSSRIVATAEDTTNIAKYGLLQEVESVDDKDISKATNIANNKLKELNRINEDTTISLLGNDDVRAGRILEVANTIFDLKGQYLVKSCTHTYSNSIHKMSITVEKVNS
ncbi:XkdQ/YqbQ family protein [Wukongibacter sp. M2B1]|uniref:XkdQ/YqbQ family protein n=1 Tax=Wukongibacter sp. M2B1 TaxID=3088895 RepID=UPI003D79A483